MTTIQVRIDDSVKKAADSLFTSLGLDTSTAVRMFLRASLNKQGIPFSVKQHTAKKDLLKAIEDSRNRKNLSKPFDTATEAVEAMLAN